MKPPAIIFVIGFHRSGSSALTGVLHLLGYNVGPEEGRIPANQWNSKGYFEQLSTMQLNDTILGLSGNTWYDLFKIKEIPEVDTGAGPRYHPIYKHIEYLASTGMPLVIKDPRICLLWPMWKHATEHYLSNKSFEYRNEPFELTYKVIFAKRGPIDSIKSFFHSQLKKISMDDCVTLYSEYLKHINKIWETECYRNVSMTEVYYEALLNNTEYILDKLHEKYNIELATNHDHRLIIKDQFIDRSLRTQGA